MRCVALAVLVVGTLGQRKAKNGPDGKPLLNRPILEECRNRVSHMKIGSHNYYLSWRDNYRRQEDWDWFNGRNFCRERCMDLVSFEGEEEWRRIQGAGVPGGFWTSGRKCNFPNKGCGAAHLQPINVNGWFWSGNSNGNGPNGRIAATNSGQGHWSHTGPSGKAQPDNFEGLRKGQTSKSRGSRGVTTEGLKEYNDEACLIVHNNKFSDGVKWHDAACHTRSAIVCEDSDVLIAHVLKTNGVDVSQPGGSSSSSRPSSSSSSSPRRSSSSRRSFSSTPQRSSFSSPRRFSSSPRRSSPRRSFSSFGR